MNQFSYPTSTAPAKTTGTLVRVRARSSLVPIVAMGQTRH